MPIPELWYGAHYRHTWKPTLSWITINCVSIKKYNNLYWLKLWCWGLIPIDIVSEMQCHWTKRILQIQISGCSFSCQSVAPLWLKAYLAKGYFRLDTPITLQVVGDWHGIEQIRDTQLMFKWTSSRYSMLAADDTNSELLIRFRGLNPMWVKE